MFFSQIIKMVYLYQVINKLLSDSVSGLYIWNGIASGTTLLTLILWGALFGSSISRNIAITDTLASQLTYTSSGLAELGFCYW